MFVYIYINVYVSYCFTNIGHCLLVFRSRGARGARRAREARGAREARQARGARGARAGSMNAFCFLVFFYELLCVTVGARTYL